MYRMFTQNKRHLCGIIFFRCRHATKIISDFLILACTRRMVPSWPLAEGIQTKRSNNVKLCQDRELAHSRQSDSKIGIDNLQPIDVATSKGAFMPASNSRSNTLISFWRLESWKIYQIKYKKCRRSHCVREFIRALGTVNGCRDTCQSLELTVVLSKRGDQICPAGIFCYRTRLEWTSNLFSR